MLQKIYKSKLSKIFAVFTVINLLSQIIAPNVAFALAGGPSQPEVQSFEPIGTSDMVDLFSGDFTYNIPLMDVGGYPINIAYNSGVGMDQEASWVGLGWNINPGVVNRAVRGMADDYKGDTVLNETYMKPNTTVGANIDWNLELVGLEKRNKIKAGTNKEPVPSLGFGFGIYHNSYKGLGFEFSITPSVSSGDKSKPRQSAALGMNFDTQKGISISPNLSYSTAVNTAKASGTSTSGGLGFSFNARQGTAQLNLSVSTDVDPGADANGNVKEGKENSVTASGSSSIPLLSPSTTYTPGIQTSMNTYAFDFAGRFGGELFGITGSGVAKGYYSTQRIANNIINSNAYGYLYAQNAQPNSNDLLDFNREKDASFNKSTTNLPLTNFTYDIYAVSGQGIGGNYRPYRGEVGTVYDNKSTTSSVSASVMLDFAVGNLYKAGGEFTPQSFYAESGKWADTYINRLSFKENNQPYSKYESVYFKAAGEKPAVNKSYFEKYIGEEAMRVDLIGSPGFTTGNFIANNGVKKQIPAANFRNEREKRNQLISYLTAKEAKLYAIDTAITVYPLDTNLFAGIAQGMVSPTKLNRANNHMKDHHLSEVTVLKPGGERYVYGIPAYNTKQQDVTFSTIENGANDISSYSGNVMSHASMQAGLNATIDEFYEKIEKPAFAHSYLLTAVLSPDYVDRKGDGVTDDDYGTAVKFNYGKLDNTYNWRVPFDANTASLNKAFESLPNDNKASVSYGEKELWYLQSIETKNYIAEFYTMDREDGYGVTGPDGGRGGNPMKALKKIVLYSKPDRMKNGNNAIPIKTVHFEYDYSLCPGINNSINNGGKLTLKKIYFTYGNSTKGRSNSYKFNYPTGSSTYNPEYHLKKYDRWGNFKDLNAEGTLTNSEYPYVIQDSILADRSAKAWNLSSIELPSGGILNIDYESDDYQYVQDKEAMRMFKVLGASPNENYTNNSNQLFDSNNSHSQFFFVKLPEGIANKSDMTKYMKGINDMYFRFYVDLTDGNKKEFVFGYSQISDYGKATGTTNDSIAFIKIRPVEIGDGWNSHHHVNPIVKAAWAYARTNLPQLVFPGSDPNGTNEGAIRGLIGLWEEINTIFKGYNNALEDRNFASTFTPEKSWLRLNVGIGKKYGGGARVAKIAINDNWYNMGGRLSDQSFSYGQTYKYVLEDGTSSGVAAYEPLIGGEENPLRLPKAFTEEHALVPDNEHYLEYPFGESFYPGASVGYSRVVVRNIKHDNVNRTGTGHLVHEFYTAKDFPVISKQTGIDARPTAISNKVLSSIFKIAAKDEMVVSQGYTIINNDMHGKPKAQWVFAEGYSDYSPYTFARSGVEYKYQTKNGNELDNEVNVINKNGTTEKAEVSVEMDVVADARKSTTDMFAITIKPNMDGFIVPFLIPFLLPIPSLFSPPTTEHTSFKSAVVTKVITKYGVLKETIAHDLGARVSTENLAYDAETGEVLITETKNEFNDPIYNTTFPAHWAYDRMGAAYANIGAVYTDDLKDYGGIDSGKVVIQKVNDANSLFVVGDEVDLDYKFVTKHTFFEPGWIPTRKRSWFGWWYNSWTYSQNATSRTVYNTQKGNLKAWVQQVEKNYIMLMDTAGNLINQSPTGLEAHTATIKVLRSGRRNMQTTPIGQITTLANPLNTYFGPGSKSFKEVLNASSVKFSENWGTLYCRLGQVVNPYCEGLKGNWRAERSYLYLADRIATKKDGIRKNGVYNKFNSFWNAPVASQFWKSDSTNWTFTSQVTHYDPYGFELENKDALGRYSAAVYGYNNSLPIAVSSNSQYKETAFDGFEDYDYTNFNDDHFSYRNNGLNRSSNQSHTGRYSIAVPPSNSLILRKVIEVCPE